MCSAPGPASLRSAVQIRSRRICRTLRSHPVAPLNYRPLRGHFILAGAPGFEPGNAGIKIRCLTAWRRPSNFSASGRTTLRNAGIARFTTPYRLATPQYPFRSINPPTRLQWMHISAPCHESAPRSSLDTAPVSPARPPRPPPAETHRHRIQSFGHLQNSQATSMRYPLPGKAGGPPVQGHCAPGPRENRVL